MRFRSVVMAVAVAVACVGPVARTATATETGCPPEVSIGDAVKVMEGDQMKFTVKKTAGTGCGGTPSVHLKTMLVLNSSFMAIPGPDYSNPDTDYIQQDKTITWAPGSPESSHTIWIDTRDDGKPELNENVVVCLDIPVNVTITRACGSGVLSTPWCARPDPPEICHTCQFHIDLPQPVRQSVWLNYRTHDGTARAGEDFVGIPEARVEIPAGGRSAVIGVDILPNPGNDPEEWFVLEITAIWDDHVESHRQIVTIRP